MKKRFLIGLAPLVVTAFMVMPTVAQAVPHVYKNGVISGEAKKLRTISWGTAKLTNITLGPVECHNVFAGFSENPTGGGAAVGKVQAFYPYECVATTCASLGGTKIEITPEKLPWNAAVTEPEAGVFEQLTGKKGEKGGAGSVEFLVNCEGVTKPHFFGENGTKILNNGLQIGTTPGEQEFLKSPNLESEIGAGETEGKVKVEGYASQELIEVKNP
jgi:hypothetical protein